MPKPKKVIKSDNKSSTRAVREYLKIIPEKQVSKLGIGTFRMEMKPPDPASSSILDKVSIVMKMALS